VKPLETLLEELRKACMDLRENLKDRFEGMLLFGSVARRETSKYSDIDILAAVKGKADIDLRAKIYKIITKHVKRDITLLTIDSNKLRDEDIHLYSLTLNIAADAIIICDPQGLLNNFISKGRKIIKKAKLVRYRTPDGKYGWMRKDGKPITLVEV